MNTNIYLKELKRNRTSFLIWSITIVVIISWGMFFYPVVMKDEIVQQLTALFENPFMKGMMAAFGADLAKFSDILGFYATYNGMYFMLLGSISFIGNSVSNIGAREPSSLKMNSGRWGTCNKDAVVPAMKDRHAGGDRAGSREIPLIFSRAKTYNHSS